MLTWNEAVEAMKAEKYSLALGRNIQGNVQISKSFAYRADRPHDTVESDFEDPTRAINSLLEQCRERWPAKHPFDDMTLEELVRIADAHDWTIRFGFAGTYGHKEGPNGEQWAANIEGSPGHGHSINDAVKAAMKAREQADR